MRRWQLVFISRLTGRVLVVDRFLTRRGAEREAERMGGGVAFFYPVVERVADLERKAWRAWR